MSCFIRTFFLFLVLSFFSPLCANSLKQKNFDKGTWEEEKNSLIVCKHGGEMLDWVYLFLEHATQSIEISGNFCGGECFRKCLNIIEDRLSLCEKLQVRILACKALLEEEDFQSIKRLKKLFPNRFVFQLSYTDVQFFPDLTCIDNHIKMVVVDETYFTAGGTSIDETMARDGIDYHQKNNKGLLGKILPAAQRDTDVVGSGPIAKWLRVEFFKLFKIWQLYGQSAKVAKSPISLEKTDYFPIDAFDKPFIPKFEFSKRRIANVPIKLLVSGPHQEEENVITREYEKLISLAQEEVVIGNLYFVPSGKILSNLKDLVKRGVPLTLITNGFYKDSPFFCSLYGWAIRSNYIPLFYGKNYKIWQKSLCKKDPVYPTKIYEYHIPNILYHEKVMIVDKHISIIGSYNLGKRSHRGDYELVLVIDSAEVAQDLRKVLEVEMQHSELITPEIARKWYFDPGIDFIARVQKKIYNFY